MRLILKLRSLLAALAAIALLAAVPSVVRAAPEVQDFNFYNTDIHLILKALAEVTNVTFVEDVPLEGKVTIHAAEKTPLDEVLENILRPLGLTWRIVGNVYHVGLRSGEKPAPGRPGYVQKTFMLRYVPAGEAARRLRKFLRAKGVVSVDLPMNRLTVTVPPDLLPKVEEMVKAADVEQTRKLVSIRLKILKVERQNDFSIGAAITYDDWLSSLGFASRFADTLNYTRGWVTGSSDQQDEIRYFYQNAFTYKVGGWGIDQYTAKLKLTSDVIDIKHVAEPDVSVLEGQEAIIKIGEKVPISFNDNELLRYEDVGVNITVKPQVSKDGFITMDINAIMMARLVATSGGFNYLDNREVKTTLVLLNGDTGRLGGLLLQKDLTSEQKIPLLGDLPLLGYLFKNHSDMNFRREVVILLSPSIIEDVPPHGKRTAGISALVAWLIPSTTDVVLDWSEDVPQDNVGVFRYRVYRDTRPITSLARLASVADSVPRAASSWVDETPKRRGVTYYYAVTGVDGAGNEQAVSNSPAITVPKR